MADNVITQEVTWSYRSGGAEDGTPTLSGAIVPFGALVTAHSRTITRKMVSQAGILSTDDQMRGTRTNTTETFTLMVPAAGYTFKTMLGQYIEITEQILALTAETRVGLVESWSNAGSDDGNETETIVIRYGIAGVS